MKKIERELIKKFGKKLDSELEKRVYSVNVWYCGICHRYHNVHKADTIRHIKNEHTLQEIFLG